MFYVMFGCVTLVWVGLGWFRVFEVSLGWFRFA
jgi:hypothetical protein